MMNQKKEKREAKRLSKKPIIESFLTNVSMQPFVSLK
jgi:hypothetical protein